MFKRVLQSQTLKKGLIHVDKLRHGPWIETLDLIKCFQSTSAVTPKQWDLMVGVCLERHPVITKPMSEMEERFHKYLRAKELDNSLKCDFEIYYEQAKHKKQVDISGLKMEEMDKRYLVEIESSTTEEYNKFRFAPTVTDDAVTSVKRRLDKCLLLLVEQKIGNNLYWIPPQSPVKDEESLRDTAERVLQEFCGTELSATVYGNAPFGVYKYNYSRKLRDKKERQGAQIFYYLAKYNKGRITTPIKYQWLDRLELSQQAPAEIHKSLSQFLIPE